MDNSDLIVYVLRQIDKKLNILLNMIDSYMYFKFKYRFDTKKGEFVEWKNRQK